MWTTSSWLWCAPPAWPVDCLHDHHVNTLEVDRQTQHLDIYLSESTNRRNTAGQSANTLATTGLLECGTWTYRRTDETDQHEYRVLFWKIQLQLKNIPEPKPFGFDCYRFLSFWSRCFCIYCQSDRSQVSISRRANFSEVREMMAPERVASLTSPLVMEDSGGDSVTVRRALPWEWLNANTTTLHLERPRRPNIPHFQLKF